VLYEEWTNKRYAFTKTANGYLLTYSLPEKARSHIPFIIYGTGNISGKKQSSVKDIGFDLSHELSVEVLSPKRGDNISMAKEAVIRVTYPDGSNVLDPYLNGTIQESNVVFRRAGDVYAGNYSFSEGDQKLYVSVLDRFGNGGSSKVRISGGEALLPSGLATGEGLFHAAVFFIVLLLVLVPAAYYLEQRKQRADMEREYESVMRRIEGLKEVKKSLMQEFYSRKLSEEDARKAILDNEKELVIEQDRLMQLTRRMGMRYWKTEGEQDVKDWVITELRAGKDPEDLKKQLKEKGMDPAIVDETGRNMKDL